MDTVRRKSLSLHVHTVRSKSLTLPTVANLDLLRVLSVVSPFTAIISGGFVPTVGVLQADPGVIREHDQIFRLYCHEAQRVFHDRLINKDDKRYFYGILSEMASKHFSKVCHHSRQFSW